MATLIKNGTAGTISRETAINLGDGYSIAVQGVGVFNVAVEGKLDPESPDWVTISNLTASGQFNFPAGVTRVRATVIAGTITTLQLSDYRSAAQYIGSGIGTTNTTIVTPPASNPITAVAANTLTPGQPASVDFTAGILTIGVPSGAPGSTAPITPWTPSTPVALNETRSYLGGVWQAKLAFTTGLTFDATNWNLIVAGPNIVPGLSGGTPGNLVYLKSPGTCANLDPSMRTILANGQMFFLHPCGVYLQIQTGVVNGFTGQVAGNVIALRQPTSKTDNNVISYDPNDLATYNTLAPSTFESYMEVGRAMSATELLFNFGFGSVRLADNTGGTVVTVQDKIQTTGTYPYTNNASFTAGTNWGYPYGTTGVTTFRFTTSNTTFNPNSAIAEFNTPQNYLFAATHKDAAFTDGFSQAVIGKGDGIVAPFFWCHRIYGTQAAPFAVGVRANMSATSSARSFTVGYLGGSGTWVDCTDPTCGPQLAPTLAGSTGFRVELDTIGTFVGARIYPTGSTPPKDYTVWGWQSSVNSTGGVGTICPYGRVWVSDFGAAWGAPAVAPKGP